MSFVLKSIGILGAMVYLPITIAYPLIGVVAGVDVQPTLYALWIVAAFGILTLLPNRVLHRFGLLRFSYIVLAIGATTVAVLAIAERVSTNFYGIGMTAGRVVFVLVLFASLCCGWGSFWLYGRRKTAASDSTSVHHLRDTRGEDLPSG